MIKEQDFTCEFCKKAFLRENSLINHSCTKKQRWLDRDTKWSTIGLYAYQQFYKLTKASGKKIHDNAEFIQSKFYNDFIKLGRFLSNNKILNPGAYITYLIKNSIKLNQWTSEHTYEVYVRELIGKENPDNGIERSVAYIITWSKDTEQDMQSFYDKVNTNIVTDAIRSGKISPWLIYLAPNSGKLLNRLDDSQLKLLKDILNPKIWHVKKIRYKKECNQLSEILRGYGL